MSEQGAFHDGYMAAVTVVWDYYRSSPWKAYDLDNETQRMQAAAVANTLLEVVKRLHEPLEGKAEPVLLRSE